MRTSEPYRDPADVEIEKTDGEIGFWERVFAAVISRDHYSTKSAASIADEAIEERRKRFGVK